MCSVAVRLRAIGISSLTFRGPHIVIYSYNENQRDALISQMYFRIELYMFRTGLLSIIRSRVLYTQL